MANQKISALTGLTGAGTDIAADVVAIVDTSAVETKKITVTELRTAMGYGAPGTGVATFLTTPTIANLNTAVSDADVAILGANTFTAAQTISGDLYLTPSGGVASKLHLYNAASTNETWIRDVGTGGNAVLVFEPGGSEKMRVGSASGNLLIGSTTDTAGKLQVTATSGPQIAGYYDASNSFALEINSVGLLTLTTTGSTSGFVVANPRAENFSASIVNTSGTGYGLNTRGGGAGARYVARFADNADAPVFTVLGTSVAVAPTTASTSPTTGALTVAGGIGSNLSIFAKTDMEVTDVGGGFVLKSPDGTRYRVTVANGGAISTTAA